MNLSDGRFESKVAVKLRKVAATDQTVEQRFQREGRLLARLVHSHIARILDAVPVTTHDERLTTSMAERSVREGARADPASIAAAHLLESYLAARRGAND